MLWVLIRIASVFYGEKKQNYPLIITKYSPYLFHLSYAARLGLKLKTLGFVVKLAANSAREPGNLPKTKGDKTC